MGEKRLEQDEKKDRDQKGIIMEALSYLFSAYSLKRRQAPVSAFQKCCPIVFNPTPESNNNRPGFAGFIYGPFGCKFEGSPTDAYSLL
jgi:hypothetical protein